MRRYMLFGYRTYDAMGGWEDFLSDWDTISMAKTAADQWGSNPVDKWAGNNVQIVDGRQGCIVWEGYRKEKTGEMKWTRPAGWATKEG